MIQKSLLNRQIEKLVPKHLQESLTPFLQAVKDTYKHIEDDRVLIERALEISSDELNTKNRRLRSEIKKQKQVMLEMSNLIETLSGEKVENSSNLVELANSLKKQINQGQKAMSELKLAKEEAETNVKIKEMFLANISHELRTPIHGVIGMTEIILNNTGNKPDKYYLEAIKKSADGLFVLINDILDFSKIESGELEFENIHFNLEEIFHTINTALSYKIESQNILFEYSIKSNVSTNLIGDPYRLNQILLNLINNAVKFTTLGKVEVIIDSIPLDNNQSLIKIAVKDTGIGIPSRKIPYLFDAFKQVDSSTTRKYGGTGLGLAICKKLTNLLGGTISVQSEEGQGATFSIAIPYQINTKKTTETKKTKLNPATIANVKVLIAEDHPVNQILITSILDNWNVQYDLVENGIQAVQKANLNNYDIVLMDIQMPEMDGIEATIKLKKNPKNKTLPVIALTANAIKGDAYKYTSKGMCDYLSKPFKPEELFSIIENNVITKKET
jgi:signal transduction histidine kinase/CheY-like chemotaxis protein